jgi:GAF domain-containing protein
VSEPPITAEAGASEEVLGVSSLARAIAGEAGLADVGALCWMMLKQVLPCSSLALFVPDERTDTVVGRYAAGHHASLLRGLRASPGDGIVGWVAAHRRSAVNAEPALDFGVRATKVDPPLLSSLAAPLIHDGAVVAVLSVYASSRSAFSDDHARLLDLLAPKLAASLATVCPDAADNSAPGARRQPASDLKLFKGRRSVGAG